MSVGLGMMSIIVACSVTDVFSVSNFCSISVKFTSSSTNVDTISGETSGNACVWTFELDSSLWVSLVSVNSTSSSTKVSTISAETSGNSLVVVDSTVCWKSSTLLVSVGIFFAFVESGISCDVNEEDSSNWSWTLSLRVAPTDRISIVFSANITSWDLTAGWTRLVPKSTGLE